MNVKLGAYFLGLVLLVVFIGSSLEYENVSQAEVGDSITLKVEKEEEDGGTTVNYDVEDDGDTVEVDTDTDAADDDDDNDDDDDDDDYEDEDEEVVEAVAEYCKSSNNSEVVSDLFGNKIRLEDNRTFIIPASSRAASRPRFLGLGLLTIKALVLGPLIGLTIKAALIRGLMWAIGAYLLHLFFPSLLSALGLGTGLVGFARSLQPNYSQMLLPHLANIPANLQTVLPQSMNHLVTQYARVLQPVVESIRSIPEGHCRYRAVCETATYLIRNTQFMSRSLQRISATVYLNFGTEYSKAWLDGIVESDCAVRYVQCETSPFSMVASQLAEAFRPRPTTALAGGSNVY